jgi:RimJ/RimL family protein N-acetyltransferase
VDVHLREVREEDLPAFFEHQRDPKAVAMAAVPSRDREAFLHHWHRILGDGSVVARTVVVHGHVAGNVVSWVHDEARHLGYWLGREHWGKGVGTAAVAAFLEVERTRPLYGRVADTNPSSTRILEKYGFRIVGRGRTPTGVVDVLMELPATPRPGPDR